MKLSIIIPVFNEEETITQVLQRVEHLNLGNITKEIIVVNDGSTDKTAQKIKTFLSTHTSSMQYFSQASNKGKGAAVLFGIRKATGEYGIIQDADLEYDPEQIKILLNALQKINAPVIYGTRLTILPNFTGQASKTRFLLHYLGNRMLSLITSLLYGQWITDMETCYKLFPLDVVKDLVLHAKGFEFEPEITAKLMKQRLKIYEVPITTTPRGYKQGKKLHTLRDGVKAVKTLIRYRFTN